MSGMVRHPAKVLSALMITGSLAACNHSDFKGSSKRLPATVTKEFRQKELPVAQARFVQGFAGEPGVAEFDQGEWGKLDLLVVIDNSGSMREEQTNLAGKLEPLLSHVAESDWQISVITTDGRPLACEQTLIRKGDANANQAFADAVTAGTAGYGIEQGILQAVRGLKGECLQGPWVRDDSTVAVLIVSDEDNCHAENGVYGCEGAAHREPEYLTDYLASIRTPRKDARVYGLIWHPSAECSTALKQGDAYAKAIDATGGVWGSICDADYTETLQAISEDVAKILKYELELEHEPVEDSLEVLVDGKPWDKFTLEGTLVRFTEPPPFGSKVEVKYRHGAEGTIEEAFELEKDAIEDGLVVTVDGEPLDPDAFTWNEEENRIEFKEPPPEKAKIEVSYKEEIELLNEFEIGKNVRPDSIKVLVDDKPVKGFTYKSGRVLLKETPAPGSVVKISFIPKK